MKTVVLLFLLFISLGAFSQTTPEVNISGIGIYPNPFNEKIFVQSENQLKKIEIYAENGQKVISVNQNNIVDASELKSGTYILKLHFEDQVIVRKVLKNQ